MADWKKENKSCLLWESERGQKRECPHAHNSYTASARAMAIVQRKVGEFRGRGGQSAKEGREAVETEFRQYGKKTNLKREPQITGHQHGKKQQQTPKTCRPTPQHYTYLVNLRTFVGNQREKVRETENTLGRRTGKISTAV